MVSTVQKLEAVISGKARHAAFTDWLNHPHDPNPQLGKTTWSTLARGFYKCHPF